MGKNKLGMMVALFSTGLSGVLVGALIINKPILNMDSSFASNKALIALQDGSNNGSVSSNITSSDIAERLSQDFIKISKEVTPAVVSIYSTKIVKNNYKYNNIPDDPFLKKFFDIPGHRGLDDEASKQQGLGSGVIVDPNGIILTNNHVIAGADDINVTLSDKTTYKAKVIGTDPKTDVAVIKIEKVKGKLPYAKLGDSNKLSVGEWVLAIGNPLGLTSTVTSGIISAKGRADVGVADFEDFIQTDAAINPGNSGGALINLKGEVIGINTAIASRTGGYMGIGFAIPSNMAKKIMNDLVTKGKVSRGFLGIQIQDMNENFAKSLKAESSNKGIVVVDVFKDSPAEKSGMERYDVILELNGKEVTSVSSFRNQIAGMNPGEATKLLVLRNGKKLNVEIKLSELDATKLEGQKQGDSKIDTGVLEKLGFKAEELDSEIKSQLGLDKNTYGLIVYEVSPSSNASEAGLSKGDVIQEVNRKKISNKKDFDKALSELKSGDSVLLKVLRGKGSLLIAFTLS